MLLLFKGSDLQNGIAADSNGEFKVITGIKCTVYNTLSITTFKTQYNVVKCLKVSIML